MSFSTSGGNGGRPGMMSEINVTPMVDVMLVLLIIFMVAAPMMTQGLDVNLPKVDSSALRSEDKQTILTIKPDGTVFLDDYQVEDTNNLAFQVGQVMKAKNNETIFLKADQATAYGDVAVVMGQLRAAGITSIGLVTDPADKSAATPPQGQQPVQPPAGASAPAPAAQAPAVPPTAPARSAN